MSAVPHADRNSPTAGQEALQAPQTTQLAQNHECLDFPAGLKNAPNVAKVGAISSPRHERQEPFDPPQTSMPTAVMSDAELEDEAFRQAAAEELLQLQARQAAQKSAGHSSPGQRTVPAPQVLIPAAEEIRARRKMGRPTVIDEEMQLKIVALLAAGLSVPQTAAYVGVARTTIDRALERDEEFAQEVHEARQRASLFPLNCLLREASKNWRAAAWLLSYLERKTEQERSRRERVFAAADQEIDRDLVQELREEARRERQQTEDDGELSRQRQPPLAPGRQRERPAAAARRAGRRAGSVHHSRGKRASSRTTHPGEGWCISLYRQCACAASRRVSRRAKVHQNVHQNVHQRGERRQGTEVRGQRSERVNQSRRRKRMSKRRIRSRKMSTIWSKRKSRKVRGLGSFSCSYSSS